MVVTVTSINDIIHEKLSNFFPGKSGFVEVSPGRVFLPKKFEEIYKSVENFVVREDDVWVVSYPRTGSTWVQEMVWLLGNKLDFESAKRNMLATRAPILELTAIFNDDHHQWLSDTLGNSVECLSNVPSPRFARSHLPWELLPRELHEAKPKLIYVARNPKDQCVSYYHYCKLLHGLDGSFAEFCNMFLTGTIPMGLYWNHVLPFWKNRFNSNILFLKYETMKRDLPSVIQECIDFLELDIEITSQDLSRICDHLKFDKMQENPAVNLKSFLSQDDDPESNAKFIRKGEIGDWKNYLSLEMSEKFDEWTEANTSGTGLEFTYV